MAERRDVHRPPVWNFLVCGHCDWSWSVGVIEHEALCTKHQQIILGVAGDGGVWNGVRGMGAEPRIVALVQCFGLAFFVPAHVESSWTGCTNPFYPPVARIGRRGCHGANRTQLAWLKIMDPLSGALVCLACLDSRHACIHETKMALDFVDFRRICLVLWGAIGFIGLSFGPKCSVAQPLARFWCARFPPSGWCVNCRRCACTFVCSMAL